MLKNILLVIMALSGCADQEIDYPKPYVHEVEKTDVYRKNNVFEVWYSETLEQPVKLIYTSTNRPKNVDRGSMNFHAERDVHTSDDDDYYANDWDKGHLAPAATFSDTFDNLFTTFSFLNCSLQHQDLNRGEWNYLEQQERVWDDTENLTVQVDLIFEDGHLVLPTGGHVPSRMVKHIYFESSKKWRCYDFPNNTPTKGWLEYEVKHIH
jgi:DNA/RNA endonuclease G (NUC1)